MNSGTNTKKMNTLADISLAPDLKRILRIAEVEAERRHAAAVDVQDVLVAMHQEGANVGAAMMQAGGLTLEQVRNLDFAKREEARQ